jgi:hypothetical protein
MEVCKHYDNTNCKVEIPSVLDYLCKHTVKEKEKRRNCAKTVPFTLGKTPVTGA